MMNEFETESGLMASDAAGLLVIDVQEKLWPHIFEREKVLKRMVQAIQVAGALEMPILVAEQYVKGLGPTISEIASALKEAGAAAPVEKVSFSCFGEQGFVDAFEESGIDSLAVLGIETHVCVLQTALQALDEGLDVFLLAEATGSRNPRHKDEAVARIREAGAIVGSVEMFAFEMMRTAGHPAFRTVQKVIV